MHHDFPSSTHEHKFNDIDWKKLYFENYDSFSRRQQLDSDFDFSNAYKAIIRRQELRKMFTFRQIPYRKIEHSECQQLMTDNTNQMSVNYARFSNLCDLDIVVVESQGQFRACIQFLIASEYCGKPFYIWSSEEDPMTDIKDGFNELKELFLLLSPKKFTKTISYNHDSRHCWSWTDTDELSTFNWLRFPFPLPDQSKEQPYYYLQKMISKDNHCEYIQHIYKNRDEHLICLEKDIKNILKLGYYFGIKNILYGLYGYYIGVSYIVYRYEDNDNMYIKVDCQNPEPLIKKFRSVFT
jgi:hypothetical protein